MRAAVSIRPAAPADVPAVAALAALCFSDPWPVFGFQAELDNPDSLFLVAENPDGLAGFAVARCLSPEGEILDLAVAPAGRRQGVGGALLDALLAALARRDVHAVFLEVRASNTAALALYAARGFSQCGRRKNYYTRPVEDAILMKWSK